MHIAKVLNDGPQTASKLTSAFLPPENTMAFDNVLQTIGNTPHIRINKLYGNTHKVYVKSERSNPGGSIKDRIALAMIEAAEKDGSLQPGATIIEPTSGNTGVGLALVAAVKGYKLILVMPDSMSIERRRLMLAYGATFDLTPREKGMKGAIARAQELAEQTPGAWVPQQFENPANIDIHVRTTAQEILNDFPGGVDYIITGVGTGGHLSGVAQVLKAKWPQLQVFAVEPTASPVISGGAPAPHPIQGIGAGFIPKNLKTELLDGVIQVEAEAAREYGRRSAREEGLLVGISSGATLAAIAQKLPEIPQGSTVLGFNYDTGERYLSVDGYLPA
jgi:cysteine synthase A